MSGLTLRHLVRRYGGFTAVDGVNLDMAKGELVTLLGPSGCGKTTTLRMVAGFIQPDGGDILFGGRRMNDVPPHRRNTAMVFQSYALFPHMTVAENIAFGLKMRKVPAAEQAKRIFEAIDTVSLTGLEKRRPGQLSGGQQQRVALARAIVTQPDILLFDEPLSNLDAKLREKVRLEIRQLQKRLGVTTLYVTHDQVEAMAISDRIVVMNKGRIEQIGEPEAIYRSPRTAFVADFLGAANIVEGRALGGGVVETAVGRFTLSADSAAVSGLVRLSWRPEHVRISPAGQGNIHAARVRSVVFAGSFTDLVVEAGGQALRVQLDPDARVREGDVLELTVAADRIRMVE
jgi:iron(III) transport system ATP-binding protein